MQFEKSQTFHNLARSFAGECQAGMRYQFVAELAKQEIGEALQAKIKMIAKNETAHAKAFYDMMHEKAGKEIKAVEFTAGFPYSAGTLAEGLQYAVSTEQAEIEDVYPKFRDTAKKEGFDDIAALFEKVIEVEKTHKKTFQTLYEGVKNKTLYKGEKETEWTCSYCGHTEKRKSAWTVCPLCGKKQGYVTIPDKEEEMTTTKNCSGKACSGTKTAKSKKTTGKTTAKKTTRAK